MISVLSLLRRHRGNNAKVAMSTSNAQIPASKTQSPLKGTKTSWRNG